MAITPKEEADLDKLAALAPAATPAKRVGRSAAQGGAGYFVAEWAQEWHWFNSASWTAEQAAHRWALITTLFVVGAATIHNTLPAAGRFVAAWWKSRHADDGQTDLRGAVGLILIGALAVIAVVVAYRLINHDPTGI